MRLLLARMVVYYVMALALFFGDGYEQVMRRLVGSLRQMGVWRQGWVVPSTAALTKARARLGPEPLKVLFERVAVPMAPADLAHGWCAGRRVMAVDGTNVDLAETAPKRHRVRLRVGRWRLPSGARGGTGRDRDPCGHCGGHRPCPRRGTCPFRRAPSSSGAWHAGAG